MSDDRTFWTNVAGLIREEAARRGEKPPPQLERVERLARGEVTMDELIAETEFAKHASAIAARAEADK